MKTSRSSSSSILRSSKTKIQEKVVYKLTKPIYMKFRPQLNQPVVQQAGLLYKIKSLSKMFSSQHTKSTLTTSGDSQIKKLFPSLKYLFKIDSQNYLIGNELQLDSIVIFVQDDQVETEVLWSFKLNTPIEKMLVHDRKKNLILVTNGQLRIYQFQGRKSKKQPSIIASFAIKGDVQLIQFAEESTVAVITEQHISTYLIDGIKSKQKANVSYKNEDNLKIFQITQSIDRIINIYFTKDHEKKERQSKKFFELWCLGLQFKQKLCLKQMKMIYLIQQKYKDSLKIFALDKDCCIMNLGKAIYLFKNNYYIDKITINIHSEYSYLQLFNQKTIALVCETQIDFYQLITDLVSNPPKITVKSFDSIRRDAFDGKYRYLDGLKFEENKYIFFFQIPNANYSGQINYKFYITQKWQYEQKINSMLPTIQQFNGKLQDGEAKQLLEGISICWDVLNKMGLSRKDAYLRIWRQSKKQSIEQYNLLLDTHDYKTIRQQIQLKLKKKSMLLIEVFKIQLGCLNMIQQNVFSSKYTADQFKNYVVSHYLIRKIQSFKEIRIYQKQVGKLRVTQSTEKESKFYINIQEYTHVKESDLKQELLELIRGLVQLGKDNATEIRMLIKKFRFSLRIFYEELLKDIITIAKRDILYLLQTIPELLPYEYPPNKQLEYPDLYLGIWGTLKDEQWQKRLYLDNVATIYNKQLIMQQQNNLWIKRNWLRYHDMIFLTRKQIMDEFNKIKDDKLFFTLINLLFQLEKDKDKLEKIINYMQDTYILFPHHLYNHVHLYRELYLYFKTNSKSQDTFETFLVKKDQQIMKQIFDHEKIKKGSFLKQVKPIYEKVNQTFKFNRELLNYFSSNLSEPSDIKYLLNRINNQKKEFHAENEEMYEVLIKGMQIKLKLGSQKDIPIQQVLIYIQNLPLKEDNPMTRQLQTLKKINEKGDKFRQIKLNMSVFEIIRMRQIVLYNLIGFQVQYSGIRKDRQASTIISKSQKILSQIKQIRKIYDTEQDNINLFIFLIKILETIQMVPFIHDIIQNNKNQTILFDNGQIQNAVYYSYKRALSSNPSYEQNNSFIQQLLSLLPQDNHLRIFIQSEFQLASIFNQNPRKIEYPISGESGVITILQLTAIIKSLDKNILPTLNISRVIQLSKIMQQIIVGQTQLQQFQIYQVYCITLLKYGKLKESMEIIKILIGLSKNSNQNIVYPIVIFRYIFSELIDENKHLMAQVIRVFIDRPLELLELYMGLLSNSYSNQDQKKLLLQTIQTSKGQVLRFNHDNVLFDEDVALFMKENPDKKQLFNNWFQHYYQQLLHYEDGFNKNPDTFLIYLLILKDSALVAKYVTFLRYQLNLRMARGLLSFISKFQAFDGLKVLHFGKKLFKIMYDLQKNTFNPQALFSQILISHEQQINLLNIVHNTKNVQILALSFQRFKAKIKTREILQAKSQKKIGQLVNKRQIKLNRIKELLQNTQKQIVFQYNYNDSDDYVSKVQKLTAKNVQKVQKKQFNVNKFLMWLFDRKNQLIEYYLLKGNEDEAEQTLRKHEQKLKFSFTKTSNNKPLDQNAGLILKAFTLNTQPLFSNNQKPFSSKNFFSLINPISQIPLVTQSQINAQDLFFNPTSQVIISQSSIIKDELLKSMVINQDQVSYDTGLLSNLQRKDELQLTLPLLFKDIYYQPTINMQKALRLMRQIHKKHSKLIFLNQQNIQIYIKIEQLINKLHISLQTRSLLPLQGLYIRQKQPSHLFNFIKPSLFQQLNENNVHTLARIISLSFKKQQFQQDINSQFLNNIISQFEQLDGSNELDENLKIEKISAFLVSMQISQLKMQTPKTIAQMTNKQKRNKVVSLISDALRQKNDLKSAQMFEAKFMVVA